MTRITTKLLTVLLLGAGIWCCSLFASQEASAQDWNSRIRYQQPSDLFYNHYVGPGPGGVPAQMYVSPQPVPPHVGHMYNTYQPFYPHEMMYHHKRSWYTYHAGAGWTRTRCEV